MTEEKNIPEEPKKTTPKQAVPVPAVPEEAKPVIPSPQAVKPPVAPAVIKLAVPPTTTATSAPAVKSPAASTGKPASIPAGKPTSSERRQFMITWLGFAWSIFAVATATALSTCLRFMFPNVLFEPKMAFKIGAPDSYEVGKVDTSWEDKYGVWIVRSPEGIYALSTVCTHLGCKPSWLDGEQKFKCPCHGSGFYKSGINFEGPAPRPLERFSIILADDGQILVDKSKKFQYEKGEWSNPLSLLAL